MVNYEFGMQILDIDRNQKNTFHSSSATYQEEDETEYNPNGLKRSETRISVNVQHWSSETNVVHPVRWNFDGLVPSEQRTEWSAQYEPDCLTPIFENSRNSEH